MTWVPNAGDSSRDVMTEFLWLTTWSCDHVTKPELIDELAAVVWRPDRVWVPLDLESFQLGTVLRETDDDLVDVYLRTHS